jgi:hypothetical protein
LLLQLRSVMEKAGMYNVDLKCSQDGDEWTCNVVSEVILKTILNQ